MTILKLKTRCLSKTVFNCLALLLLALFLGNCSKNTGEIPLRTASVEVLGSAIDINYASFDELEKLPNVGAATAKKIIDHRKKFGRFRKPEHLILVSGISDKRFREIRSMVKVR